MSSRQFNGTLAICVTLMAGVIGGAFGYVYGYTDGKFAAHVEPQYVTVHPLLRGDERGGQQYLYIRYNGGWCYAELRDYDGRKVEVPTP